MKGPECMNKIRLFNLKNKKNIGLQYTPNALDGTLGFLKKVFH